MDNVMLPRCACMPVCVSKEPHEELQCYLRRF
jgi:hypothetical protein